MSASICGSPSVVLSTVNRNRINLWGNSKTKWFSDRVRFHLHLFIFYIIFTCHCEPRSAGRSNLYNKDRFVSRRDVGILAMTDYIEGMFMCGIFGYVGFRKNAPSIVLVGLKKLEYRGYDSWGVAAVIQNLEFRIQNKKPLFTTEFLKITRRLKVIFLKRDTGSSRRQIRKSSHTA
ncbi:MAG: Glucosamine/fructose-6-phosphate aminotransferase, isomerizing [Microgenomates group bacterium GW2011_GWC1_43_11]|nr:MAG: Glucosamine/fructose-6-phosphate aminotransferase, isomerizing [Microgenomates group bacterium GW2011_GWC1_43_11]